MDKETNNVRNDTIISNFYVKENIEHFRRSKGLSQEQLGKMLGYSRTTVGNWETGYRIPDVIDLFRLSRIFDITTDDLLTKNFKTKKNEEEKK